MGGGPERERTARSAETLASLAAANATLAAPTIVTNYPTAEAMALCTGGMIERGAAMKDIDSWKTKACGLDAAPCLLDYHVDHGTSAGAGATRSTRRRSRSSSSACTWPRRTSASARAGAERARARAPRNSKTHPYPEYAWPLGAPLGPYNVSAGAYGDVYTVARSRAARRSTAGSSSPPDGGAAWPPPPQRGGGARARARRRRRRRAAAAAPAGAEVVDARRRRCANGNMTASSNCDAGLLSAAADRDAGAQREGALQAGVPAGARRRASDAAHTLDPYVAGVHNGPFLALPGIP